MNKLTPLQVSRLVNDKNSMYNAVYRNGYLLPPKRDSFNTYEFLDKVRTEEYWLPKTHQCKMYTCLDPPPKDTLAVMVRDAIYRHIEKFES